MTDWVSVRNLRLRGRHGVLPEEARLGQEFQLDIDCALDAEPCARDDDYERSVCYASLCETARDVSQAGPYRLVETLAHRVIEAILARHGVVERVVVTVRKPSAPIDAQFDWVGVTLERRRRRAVGLSLGSNMGDTRSNLRAAVDHLGTVSGLELDRVSRLYRTAPWGDTDQDWFLNACATGWTTLAPEELLRTLKRIELALGRAPSRRWGPRAIDVDLLFVDDLERDTPFLTLPHPGLFERAFVLIPLAEIAPERAVLGRSVAEAAAAVLGTDEVVAEDD